MSTIKPVKLNKNFLQKQEPKADIMDNVNDHIFKCHKCTDDYSFSNIAIVSILTMTLCILTENFLLAKSR